MKTQKCSVGKETIDGAGHGADEFYQEEVLKLVENFLARVL